MSHDTKTSAMFRQTTYFEIITETRVDSMKEKLLSGGIIVVVLLAMSGEALSQSGQQNGTLIVSGQPGQAPVLRMNGRSYVDIETLARLTNGSLSFKGNQVTLVLPGLATGSPTAAPPPSQPVRFRIFERFLEGRDRNHVRD